MLTKEEIQSLVDGAWQLDCQVITLRPRSPDAPSVSAPGWIKYGRDGELRFKLLGAGDLDLMHNTIHKETAGRMARPEEFYDLEALDEFHREWRSERVHVDSVGGAVEGRAPRLTIEQSTATQNEYLRLVLPETINLPFNVRTDITTSVGGRIAGQETQWNVAKFEALGHRFQVTNIASTLRLEIVCDQGHLHRDIELLATDALAFCLARPLTWILAERCGGGVHRVEVRPRRLETKKGRRLPPRDLSHEQPEKAVWLIFERYLMYTSQRESESRHPMSAHVLDVLDAAIATIEAHALTLCVAIEGLAGVAFPNHTTPPDAYFESLERAKRLLACKTIDPGFSRRFQGLLGMMSHPSAKDNLRALVEAGVITKSQLDDWDSLRHRSAHGGRFANMPRQEFIDLLFRVLVLFYHLVFGAIGYTGEYTDYGTHGWPTRVYSSKIDVSPVI